MTWYKYKIYYIKVCAHITLEFSVIPEAKPRDNRKRESYNERITHTLAYLTYTIVTIEIAKSVGYVGKSVDYVGKSVGYVGGEKCGLCRGGKVWVMPL